MASCLLPNLKVQPVQEPGLSVGISVEHGAVFVRDLERVAPSLTRLNNVNSFLSCEFLRPQLT